MGTPSPLFRLLRILVVLARDDDVRATGSAFFFFAYLAGILVFLAYVPIPSTNGNIVHLIIGSIMGAGVGPAIRAMFNKKLMSPHDGDDLELGDPDGE